MGTFGASASCQPREHRIEAMSQAGAVAAALDEDSNRRSMCRLASGMRAIKPRRRPASVALLSHVTVVLRSLPSRCTFSFGIRSLQDGMGCVSM